jgi:hypothetical protein
MTLPLEFKTTVKCCARCQQDHIDLEFKPIENLDIATHFAICPTNGQPILLKTHKKRSRKPLAIADPAKFEIFWKAYPRKMAKGAAFKAFAAVTAGKYMDAILKALEWQKRSPEWLKERGAFIPHPATWLRAHRWEDEPGVQLMPERNGMLPPEAKR